ncbi:MAG: hypothetical protein RL682_175, partial [Pseudomonadota bacterium]
GIGRGSLVAGQAQGASTPRGEPAGFMATGRSPEEQAKDRAGIAYDENVAKDVVDQRKTIMNNGFNAGAKIATMQRIGNLLADHDGGKLSQTAMDLASAANSMGMKIDKNLPNKEAASVLANEMALGLRSTAGGEGMPGALSDGDRKFLVKMPPGIEQSAEGRKMIIEAHVAVLKRQQQVAEFARAYEKKNNRLDNGFFDQLQQWSNDNPLFKQGQ